MFLMGFCIEAAPKGRDSHRPSAPEVYCRSGSIFSMVISPQKIRGDSSIEYGCKKNMSKHQSVQYGSVHSASYSLAANAKKDIQGLQFPLSKPLELSEDSLDFRLLDLLLSLKSSISHRRLRWY